MVIVGTDRVAANGDMGQTKIGTYSLAVLARHHKIPFYVATRLQPLICKLLMVEILPIEERDPREN